MITNNVVEASASRQHDSNKSGTKDPDRGRKWENIAYLLAWNQSIDSGDYEYESLSDISCELGVDVIHAYVTQPNVVDESSIGSDKFGSQFVLVDHVDLSRHPLDLVSFGAFSIGSTSLITRDNFFHINNLEASTLLSPLHPNIIDWSI